MLEAGDAAQGRGLAAARGPEQDHDLAGRHGKADAVDGRPADRELLAQVGDVERRRHDLKCFMRATITAGSRRSCPIRQPRPVQLHVLVELRQPDLDDLGIEAFGIDRRHLQRGQVAELLDHEGLALFRQAPVEEQFCGIGMGGGLRNSRGIGIDRRAFGREENLDRRAVLLFRIDRIVEQGAHRDFAAHHRIRHRRARRIEDRMGGGLLRPIILAQHLALEHDAGPGGAAGLGEHLPGHLVVLGLGQIHPGLRRVLHQLGVVGDRPHQRGARPQFWRNLRLGIVVGGVRRRIILEHVGERQHQRAVGMIDHVGDQLAGRRLGLDTGDELAARRAHHLDLDLREALVEFLDDLLFDLGEIRGVIDELAFGFRRRDQFGRTEFLGTCG